MKTVAVYHKSIPNKKNQEKVDVLKFFAGGAKVSKDKVYDIHDYFYHEADVAVIQGWVTPEQPTSPHSELRHRVIQYQMMRAKYVVGIDSNLFLYADTANPHHYLRYSFNGVFPNTGLYCDKIIDPTRWMKISRAMNIQLKDYRPNGNHILLCLQRDGGWSMNGKNSQDWAIETIAEIRKHSNRPIVIRLHPGDKETKRIFKAGKPLCQVDFNYGVSLSHNESLLDDLRGCWAAVNHNSSPVVGAAIEGYPVFVTDSVRSQCRDIANTDLSQIENPQMPDRQQWIERLSMFHWNFAELRSGECWSHMRQFI